MYKNSTRCVYLFMSNPNAMLLVTRPLNGIATFGIATWHCDQSGLSHFHVRTCSYTLVAPPPEWARSAQPPAHSNTNTNNQTVTMGSHSPPILAIPFPSPPVPVTFSWSHSSAALRRAPVHYGPFNFGSPHTRRRSHVASRAPSPAAGRAANAALESLLACAEGRTGRGGVRDGGRCSVSAGERLGGAGRGPVSL